MKQEEFITTWNSILSEGELGYENYNVQTGDFLLRIHGDNDTPEESIIFSVGRSLSQDPSEEPTYVARVVFDGFIENEQFELTKEEFESASEAYEEAQSNAFNVYKDKIKEERNVSLNDLLTKYNK